MTELPIADFSLNNKYIFKLGIKDSKVNINSVDRKNINSYYQKNSNILNKNLLNKYEFSFKIELKFYQILILI